MKGTLTLNRVENARAIIQANMDYLISRVVFLLLNSKILGDTLRRRKYGAKES
jgi:hypothetical protein